MFAIAINEASYHGISNMFAGIINNLNICLVMTLVINFKTHNSASIYLIFILSKTVRIIVMHKKRAHPTGGMCSIAYSPSNSSIAEV